MTRYALARREPLLVELETFVAYVAGDADAGVVTLVEGLETVICAEAVLESARRARRWPGRRRRSVKAVVVALGKIGLPLAAAIARAGHEVVGCDIDPRVVEAGQRRARAVPGRGRPGRGARRGGGRRPPARDRPTRRAAVAEGADLVVAVPPLVVDEQAQPDWRDPRRRARRHRRRARRRRWTARPVSVETTRAGRHDARAGRPGARAPERPARRGGLLLRVQPRARVQRPRLRRSRDLPQARRRAQRRGRGARRRLYERVPARRGLEAGLGRGGRADQARRDDLPRRQHRVRQRAGALRRRAGVDVRARDRRRQQPAVQPHPPAGRRGRRALHPGLPALLPGGRPPRAPARRRARGQRGDARLRRRAAGRELGGSGAWRASACSSWASPTAAR